MEQSASLSAVFPSLLLYNTGLIGHSRREPRIQLKANCLSSAHCVYSYEKESYSGSHQYILYETAIG